MPFNLRVLQDLWFGLIDRRGFWKTKELLLDESGEETDLVVLPDEDEDDGEGAPMIEGEGLAVEITQSILERMGFRRAEAYGRSLLPMDDADHPSILVEVEVEEQDEDAFLDHNTEGLNALQTLVRPTH